ncbi:MAG: tyrosine-protein phosphatase [Bdellovibrionales bacterium]
MRCAQPFTRSQWNALYRRHGFASILNLRGINSNAGWYLDEKAASFAYQCDHNDLLVSSKRLPSRDTLIQMVDAFRTLPRPLLIKCAGGSDRTGLASAIYLLDINGMEALPEAYRHLTAFPYLHIPKANQRWIRELINFYAETHHGQNIATWIETTYSDAALADRLESQNKGDYWKRDKR